MSVNGRIALITGAGGALGRVTSRRFREAGAQLVLCDAASEGVEQLRHEYRGTPCLTEQTDLTDAAQVGALVERALAAFSRIDILLNIAGRYRGGIPVVEMSAEDLEFSLAHNVKTVFLTCRAVIPHMVRQRWGRIINIGARAGLAGRAGASGHAVAKGGVLRLTESLAEEVRDSGVTVNAVIPSYIDTPANRATWPDADHSRWVPPEHLAATMLFLCSEEAASITGARIPVFNRS